MIDNKVIKYEDFLKESNDTTSEIIIGSYKKLKGNKIGFVSKKFNEDSEEDNFPGMTIVVEDKICSISYGKGDSIKNIEIPQNSINFPGSMENPEEVNILNDSKWARDEKNMDSLYEFLEGYLNEYYKEKLNHNKDPKSICIEETQILMEEFGNMEVISELDKFESDLHSFTGNDERYYKFKRKDKGPIASIEIYEKRGSKDPQVSLYLGKVNSCRIKIENENYEISGDSFSEIKKNFIFSSLISSPTIKDSPESENSLKDLLKSELELKRKSQEDRTTGGNIDFLKEVLKSHLDIKEIESFIRDNT